MVFVRSGVMVFVRGKLPRITGFCGNLPRVALSAPRSLERRGDVLSCVAGVERFGELERRFEAPG